MRTAYANTLMSTLLEISMLANIFFFFVFLPLDKIFRNCSYWTQSTVEENSCTISLKCIFKTMSRLKRKKRALVGDSINWQLNHMSYEFHTVYTNFTSISYFSNGNRMFARLKLLHKLWFTIRKGHKNVS